MPRLHNETILKYLETQISGVIAELAVTEGFNGMSITEGGCTFRVRGAKLWNRIPLDMRKKDTAGAFKNALKKTFF